MHEVLTLQFGQQANYVGTHYWNTQESYFTYSGQEESPVDHDRSFRPGIGVDGADTYTPRALIYDLKNAFGSLRRDNELFNNVRPEDLLQQNVWGQRTSTLQLPVIPESAYQQALNLGSPPQTPQVDTVRYWSDYNNVFYHPRSMVQLNEYEVNSSIMPFERYETGEALFDTLDREYDILDRDMRPFLEECDQLQAINLIASTTDAWGGFASRYAERLNDDLGKGCRWLFGLQENARADRARMGMRLVNAVQCLNAVTDSISLHIPLKTSLHSAGGNLASASHPWQSSALQATAVESLTLPMRLKQATPGQAAAHELEQVMNLDGRRGIVAAGMSLSDAAAVSEEVIVSDHRMINGLTYDEVDDLEEIMDIDMFPERLPARGQTVKRNRVFSRMLVARSVSIAAGKETGEDGKKTESRVDLPFPVLASYPKTLLLNCQSDKVDVRASASSSERAAAYLRESAVASHGLLPVDVREELYDSLISRAEQYEDSMSFSDDEDYDD